MDVLRSWLGIAGSWFRGRLVHYCLGNVNCVDGFVVGERGKKEKQQERRKGEENRTKARPQREGEGSLRSSNTLPLQQPLDGNYGGVAGLSIRQG